ncbi:MAG: helix-hairpin-helix domain-containing protein [Bacteroidetes bacterium]|nr:helix-hairpin-helix domain-containing protein [Bacteroidota bacterium]
MKIWFLLLFIPILSLLPAGSVLAGFESRKPAGSGAVSARFASYEALWGNPAGLAGLSDPVLMVTATRPYGLTELTSLYALGVWPSGALIPGFSVHQMGSDLYRELTASAWLATRLTGSLSAGLSLNMHHLRIDRGGQAFSWSADVGVQIEAVPGLRLGIQADNLFQQTIGRSREPLPFMLRGGMWASLTTWLEAGADLVAEPHWPVDLVTGLVLRPHESFRLELNWQESTHQWSAGVSGILPVVTTRYQVLVHPHLGLTHQVSVLVGRIEIKNPHMLFPEPSPSTATKKRERVIPLVDLNLATVDQWTQLPGITDRLAKNIVEWRTRRNGFVSVDELLGVPGMTPDQLERIRPYVVVREPAPAADPAPAQPD